MTSFQPEQSLAKQCPFPQTGSAKQLSSKGIDTLPIDMKQCPFPQTCSVHMLPVRALTLFQPRLSQVKKCPFPQTDSAQQPSSKGIDISTTMTRSSARFHKPAAPSSCQVRALTLFTNPGRQATTPTAEQCPLHPICSSHMPRKGA